MKQESLSTVIRELTWRALWEVRNVVACIPDDRWESLRCGVPLYQHVYHMLHSLDRWMINPSAGYKEPPIHHPNLNNLDIPASKPLSRAEIQAYLSGICAKIAAYLDTLTDDMLLEYPPNCPYTRFTLILAQHRHLHTHMGMLMGFIVDDTGRWPHVVGLEGAFEPQGLGLFES
ncbi:DinB family protein [Candidatus Soleaferrea massiliensis]|uniref:DinB family protein n=1 Tax=Candidatus Soleaferrea massiliensis TaxID=1470354 RepID=UPI00058BDE00|nr:DinB family protein [Candidatus Soleaferrea massiliensis]